MRGLQRRLLPVQVSGAIVGSRRSAARPSPWASLGSTILGPVWAANTLSQSHRYLSGAVAASIDSQCAKADEHALQHQSPNQADMTRSQLVVIAKESRKVTCPFTSGGSSMSPLAGTPLGPCSSSCWCWLGLGAWAPWTHMGPSGRWHRQPGGTCVPAAPYWRLRSGRPREGSGSRPSGATRPASAGAPAPLLVAPTAAPRKSTKWAAGSSLTLRCSPQWNRASRTNRTRSTAAG
jgi:hypothetical protein